MDFNELTHCCKSRNYASFSHDVFEYYCSVDKTVYTELPWRRDIETILPERFNVNFKLYLIYTLKSTICFIRIFTNYL